jgi:hypothetical protein
MSSHPSSTHHDARVIEREPGDPKEIQNRLISSCPALRDAVVRQPRIRHIAERTARLLLDLVPDENYQKPLALRVIQNGAETLCHSHDWPQAMRVMAGLAVGMFSCTIFVRNRRGRWVIWRPLETDLADFVQDADLVRVTPDPFPGANDPGALLLAASRILDITDLLASGLVMDYRPPEDPLEIF